MLPESQTTYQLAFSHFLSAASEDLKAPSYQCEGLLDHKTHVGPKLTLSYSIFKVYRLDRLNLKRLVLSNKRGRNEAHKSEPLLF